MQRSHGLPTEQKSVSSSLNWGEELPLLSRLLRIVGLEAFLEWSGTGRREGHGGSEVWRYPAPV